MNQSDKGHLAVVLLTLAGGGWLSHVDPSLQAVIMPVLASVVFHFLGVKQGQNGGPK